MKNKWNKIGTTENLLHFDIYTVTHVYYKNSNQDVQTKYLKQFQLHTSFLKYNCLYKNFTSFINPNTDTKM